MSARVAELGIRTLIRHVEPDPDREGLADTPARVVRAFREMTAGYGLSASDVLGTTFDETCDEMVVVNGIEFTSLCEHHLLPFVGTASVGYIPGKRVVGLSKIPRLVDMFAHRLQIQERMTRQIADAMLEVLDPIGVAVVIDGRHSCMACRGVRKSTASMVTSAMLGLFRVDARARAEFLTLAGR